MQKLRLLTICIILLLSACLQRPTPENNIESLHEPKNAEAVQKKVVLVIIDSMTDSLIQKNLSKEGIPALQFLIEHGKYYKDLVVPFPSMSVTIESTLATGEMADQHHVPGLAWYHQEEDRLVNYGSSIHTVVKNGLTQTAYDFLFHLNNTHLNPKTVTIFEELDRHNLTSATINTLVYRGNHIHQLDLSGIVNNITGLPESIETKGPNMLALGRFAKPELLKNVQVSDGLFDRYGFHDQFSMEVTQTLIAQGQQPDFLMIFLPDLDQTIHDEGPEFTLGLAHVDKYLQGILNAYGSWEKALEESIFIIIGDHGQVKITDDRDKASIDLDNLYATYTRSTLGEPVSQRQIAFAVNQRMAYVYDVHDKQLLPDLAKLAKQDKRVALAAWLENGWVHVICPDSAKSFRYNREGSWRDTYGQTWQFEGDPSILSLQLDKKKQTISYTEYPDVLNQIYSSLHSHPASKLILAAKSGYSFTTETIPVHPDGGDHGGLHKTDTLAAMIIAGTTREPEHIRMVDLKNYILQLLLSES